MAAVFAVVVLVGCVVVVVVAVGIATRPNGVWFFGRNR